MQKLPANISRRFTMYFTLFFFYCSVNWQQCGIIVPLGLIQCAFGYQCHLFYFISNSDSPFHLFWKTHGDSLAHVWASPKDTSQSSLNGTWEQVAAQLRLYMQFGHSMFFILWFERINTFWALFQQGCLSKRQQLLLQWHRTSVFTTAFMLS